DCRAAAGLPRRRNCADASIRYSRYSGRRLESQSNLNWLNHLLFCARMLYCASAPRGPPILPGISGHRSMSNVRKILIVDDDAELRDALVEQLSLHEEFEAIAADTGAKGVQVARTGQIDLVIMDVGLPDIDGRETVRLLRKNGFKAPIIMLTGHDTDSDTILGLESGANDYVTKPFR